MNKHSQQKKKLPHFDMKKSQTMLFHATYHYLFEMHFKDYQATHLHLMINSFQGICMDLKCFKGNAFFCLKGKYI